MTREEVADLFRKGFDCSQVVLMTFADELGYDEEELARIGASFGGGMFNGDTCGCVTGALMALGMKYGHGEPNEFEKKADIQAKGKAFRKAFSERCGSIYCRELVPFDFSKEGEGARAAESGILMERCPGYVLAAIEEAGKILECEA